MLDFNTMDIVSVQKSIKSMERLLEVNAIPNAKPTRDNTVGVPGETQFMQLKCLLSFKLYITFNIYFYAS